MSVEVRGLSFAYGRWEALSDISTFAGPGRITAVLGPNAAGKSTLLRCCMGALRPARGCVFIDGKPSHRLATRELAQRIAYVPQRATVAASFTVRQVVELGRYALPPSATTVSAALERLELTELAERSYHALSVGQQQRVTLARALAQINPDGHLILDEPCSAMDLRHLGLSMRLLRELAAGGATVIVAMHDLPLAAAVAHEAWLLKGGRLVESGPTTDVLRIESLEAVFEVPFQWVGLPGGARRLLIAPGASAPGTATPATDTRG